MKNWHNKKLQKFSNKIIHSFWFMKIKEKILLDLLRLNNFHSNISRTKIWKFQTLLKKEPQGFYPFIKILIYLKCWCYSKLIVLELLWFAMKRKKLIQEFHLSCIQYFFYFILEKWYDYEKERSQYYWCYIPLSNIWSNYWFWNEILEKRKIKKENLIKSINITQKHVKNRITTFKK